MFQILIYFSCENCNPPPPWKKSPPFSQQPPLKIWGGGVHTMTMSFSRIILNLMLWDSKKCFKKKFITMTLKQNVAWWLSQSSKLFWGKSSNCSNVVTGNPFLNLIWSLLILAFDFWNECSLPKKKQCLGKLLRELIRF